MLFMTVGQKTKRTILTIRALLSGLSDRRWTQNTYGRIEMV